MEKFDHATGDDALINSEFSSTTGVGKKQDVLGPSLLRVADDTALTWERCQPARQRANLKPIIGIGKANDIDPQSFSDHDSRRPAQGDGALF